MESEHDAIIWTEGKTDWQHLKRAYQALRINPRLTFEEIRTSVGDDQLIKQCAALAKVKQSHPNIFVFDRDSDQTVIKVDDDAVGYKSWGNNVFSFAIPVPYHRQGQFAICIEKYYTDVEIQTADAAGRRLFLSSEFNASSRRHKSNSTLSVGNKNKLAALVKAGGSRILDSEVYDDQHQNVALSKAEFAEHVLNRRDDFAGLQVDSFRAILGVVANILKHTDHELALAFGELSVFRQSISAIDTASQLAAVVDASIRLSKLLIMTFASMTFRYYEPLAANSPYLHKALAAYPTSSNRQLYQPKSGNAD